jgi:Ser/Thr protein kinase RdoA (MazF antagonist)
VSSHGTTVEEGLAVSALVRYGLGGAPLRLINVSENSTFLVRAEGESQLILRVHRPDYNTLGEIASELDWLDALRADGDVLTPRVIPALDGARLVTVGTGDGEAPRACAMFEFVAGGEPEETPASLRRLGAVAGRMHRLARAWTPPAGFRRRTWDLDTTIGADQPVWGPWESGPGVGPDERRLLRTLSAVLSSRITAYGRDHDRYGLIHADLRLGNLLFDGDITCVIDFDDCGWGWYVYDLATSFTFMEDRDDIADLIAALLAGYQSELSLSAADVAILPTMMMLRRLLLVAWLASHPHTDIARTFGAPYTAATCRLADAYLTDTLAWI